MSVIKSYNATGRHSGKDLEMTLRHQRKMQSEVKRTNQLLKSIMDIVMEFRTIRPDHHVVHELSLINDCLQGVVDDWKEKTKAEPLEPQTAQTEEIYGTVAQHPSQQDVDRER